MQPMSARTMDYIDAIEHLPDDAMLVIPGSSWEEYERLLTELSDRPGLRVTYDGGRLEIMSPSPEHDEYARFIDALVRVFVEEIGLVLQAYGSATWKRRSIARGTEPDGCFYVANAHRVIGKRIIDLESDPPPDIAVEIDVTNESLTKFPVYAALGVPEIWRYDRKAVHFYELAGDGYRVVEQSRFLPRLTPMLLAEALEQSKTAGQTAALTAFRHRVRRMNGA